MGTYVCKLKHKSKRERYARTSSREIILSFTSGNRWRMPEAVLHYAVDHGWQLPAAFANDLLNSSLDEEGSMSYKDRGAQTFDEKFGLVRVGYLGVEVPEGERGENSPKAIAALVRYVTAEKKLPGRLILASFG